MIHAGQQPGGSRPICQESPKAVVLSVVVKPVGGPVFVRRCLNGLAPQVEGRPAEIIVPYDITRSELGNLQAEFPRVRFLAVGPVRTAARPGTEAAMHDIYDRLLAVGLGAAQGEILALLEDTVVPDSEWCSQVLEAHHLPYGVIGGAVEHVGESALNWAVYFLDFGRFQPPLREGPVAYLTDINVSYKRDALATVRPLWEQSYHEVTVNWRLMRSGVILWQRPQIVVRQDRGPLHLAHTLRERLEWGKLFAQLRSQEVSPAKRALYAFGSPAIPLVMMGRTAYKALSTRRNRGRFLWSLPYLVVVTVAWCCGEFLGYVAGPRQRAPEERQLE
jgi:hypothetical protein